jgi:hypothetical protein
MSDLDEFFGPRQEDPQAQPPRLHGDELLAAALQGGTRWKCEDRIRPALNSFFACRPELLPASEAGRRMHYAAARQLTDEVGERDADAFIRWADGKLRFAALTIKDCRSLLFLLGDWRTFGQPDLDRPSLSNELLECPECGCLSGHAKGCSLEQKL